MLVRTTRTLSKMALRGIFYLALFVVVVLAHLGLTSVLRTAGVTGGLALFISGAMVLGIVLLTLAASDRLNAFVASWRERRRLAQGLPDGPCCVVWDNAEATPEDERAMPWELTSPLRPRYPGLARRLGVEGVAIVEFEVNANGVPKNIHYAHAWPSDVFFDAARDALARARFKQKDVHPRFGVSYKMPFVFRIAGASKHAERQATALTSDDVKEAMDRLRSNA